MNAERLRQNFAICKRVQKGLIRQSLAKGNPQHMGIGPYNEALALVPTYKQTLAHNIRARMAARPDVDSPEKLSRRAFWTEGKRRGKRISPRTIRYVLDARDDAPSPALDLIVAIARGLECEPWELLVDRELTRRHILEQLLRVDSIADQLPRAGRAGHDGHDGHD